MHDAWIGVGLTPDAGCLMPRYDNSDRGHQHPPRREPIRVLHVMGRMVGGGVEAFVMNHYRAIERSVVQFDFLVGEDSTVLPADEIAELGGRVFNAPPYSSIPSFARRTQEIVRTNRPAIIHSHLNAISVVPLSAASLAGSRVRIAHSHSTGAPGEPLKNAGKAVLRPLARLAPTHLAACSMHASTWLFGKRATLNGRVRIIKNAIDTTAFRFDPSDRARTRAELGIRPTDYVVGHAGRFSVQKNQMFLLKVFARLRALRPDAVLVLAGDGELRDRVIAEINKLELTGAVRLIGNRDDMPRIYNMLDVLALPSLYEGLGIVAIEAQAAGLPVVASDAVPREAAITNLVSFLPLSASPQLWASKLLVAGEQAPRSDRRSEVAAGGYDVFESAQKLAEWYRQLAGE